MGNNPVGNVDPMGTRVSEPYYSMLMKIAKANIRAGNQPLPGIWYRHASPGRDRIHAPADPSSDIGQNYTYVKGTNSVGKEVWYKFDDSAIYSMLAPATVIVEETTNGKKSRHLYAGPWFQVQPRLAEWRKKRSEAWARNDSNAKMAHKSYYYMETDPKKIEERARWSVDKVTLIGPLGDLRDLTGAVTGKDPVTGTKLSGTERWFYAGAIIFGSGAAAVKTARWAASYRWLKRLGYSDEFIDAVRKAMKRTKDVRYFGDVHHTRRAYYERVAAVLLEYGDEVGIDIPYKTAKMSGDVDVLIKSSRTIGELGGAKSVKVLEKQLTKLKALTGKGGMYEGYTAKFFYDARVARDDALDFAKRFLGPENVVPLGKLP